MRLRLCAAFLLILPSWAAGAGEPVTGAEVARRVVQVLQEQGIAARPMLAAERNYFPCDTDLHIAPRVESRWDALEVSCALPVPWSIVVRTEGQVWEQGGKSEPGGASADLVEAVVLRQSARKGQLIMPEMLERAAFATEPAQGYFIDPAEIVGRRLTANVAAGVPIRERNLRPAWAVEEGQRVAIEKDLGGITVATAGIALENGAIGDRISVRNASSNKVLQGFVSAKNKISVSANMN